MANVSDESGRRRVLLPAIFSVMYVLLPPAFGTLVFYMLMEHTLQVAGCQFENLP
jgi:hypothetical protein